ncbi:MAG TPA: alpha-glucan family phosphorylase [Patescibacteria group bacterium]|nr:alpha-glucan family phosphorylase [Patescibacteria group bacterium]
MSALPEPLARLPELARNLWWSWHPEARALFDTIARAGAQPHADNPLRLLATLDPPIVRALAADGAFRESCARVLAAFDQALAGRGAWFPAHAPPNADLPIAYFSAEFGVHQALPVYSGGLGILAGDIAKEASDLGLPLIGVGFMYPQGYFKQRIGPDGRQEESYERLEREVAPAETVRDAEGRPLRLSLPLPDRLLHVQVSAVRVGRVLLYLMDTDLESNPPWERELTARLYGGDQETRLLQEILLGIGGVRILRALGLRPGIWHANEGHAALMMVERVREQVEAGATFDQAVEQVRRQSVFTTHTPVPAGHDAFPFFLMEKYLATYWPTLGLDRDRFLALGAHEQTSGSAFNMSALAFRLSGRHSAVSVRHAEVSRRMWAPLWPGTPVERAPITAVTNGVHVASWVAPEIDALFRAHVAADWLEHHDEDALWERVDRIPDRELWDTHGRLKLRLHRFLRERARRRFTDGRSAAPRVVSSGALFDADALTLGFARRFATYKRATLLFRHPARLAALLNDPRRPIQIVFAGKAHPADQPGRRMLETVHRAATDPAYGGRVAFVEDYGIHSAQHLVQGVDVWLNTPRPPLEASGTSGQKAALNGVPNLSILDGWWVEGHDGTNGWAIAPRDAAGDGEERDEADAQELYRLLESEVAPAFYDRDADGLPQRWLRLMRRAIRTTAARFSARRMVKEYIDRLYRPCWDESPRG